MQVIPPRDFALGSPKGPWGRWVLDPAGSDIPFCFFFPFLIFPPLGNISSDDVSDADDFCIDSDFSSSFLQSKARPGEKGVVWCGETSNQARNKALNGTQSCRDSS